MFEGSARRAASAGQRLDEIVAAAVDVFHRKGYRRTQMADIGAAVGLSGSNLYNYVEGKDALFFLVLKSTLGPKDPQLEPSLPVPNPAPGDTEVWVRQRLDFVDDFPVMEAALSGVAGPTPSAELAAAIGELFDVVSHMSVGVEILEQSAHDAPQLFAVFLGVRHRLVDRWARYLALRADDRVRPGLDTNITAELIVELVGLCARRRGTGPSGRQAEPMALRGAVIDFVLHAVTTPQTQEHR